MATAPTEITEITGFDQEFRKKPRTAALKSGKRIIAGKKSDIGWGHILPVSFEAP
jgi:hypothetical protein